MKCGWLGEKSSFFGEEGAFKYSCKSKMRR